eukprot:m.25344 g.25344  ORF g.25344 m.25344 type:complete len:51 (-) comp8696_c0_seq1:85-237(-)
MYNYCQLTGRPTQTTRNQAQRSSCKNMDALGDVVTCTGSNGNEWRLTLYQ